MSILGAYDPELQMFVEDDLMDLNLYNEHVIFLKWLIDTGRLTGDTQAEEQ